MSESEKVISQICREASGEEETELVLRRLRWGTLFWVIAVLFFLSGSIIGGWRGGPNEIGDFLAGMFAPLAFVWLAAAVFLQAIELKAQRLQLEQNGKALETQAKEVRNTVAELSEQTKLMKLTGEANLRAEARENYRIAINQFNELCFFRLEAFVRNAEMGEASTLFWADEIEKLRNDRKERSETGFALELCVAIASPSLVQLVGLVERDFACNSLEVLDASLEVLILQLKRLRNEAHNYDVIGALTPPFVQARYDVFRDNFSEYLSKVSD